MDKANTKNPVMVEEPIEGCELNLSADQKWLRLVVDGKQVASFHVNYVNKVLGSSKQTKTKKPSSRKPDLSANI